MRQLLTQAGAHMVLCDQAWQATAASLAGQDRTIVVNTAGLLTDGPAVLPAVTGDPEDLAYVIYTSGSTGQPKQSQSATRDVRPRRRPPVQQRRGPAARSPSAPHLRIWIPLLSGGTVAPPGDLDPATLRATITEHGVTALWLTAAVPDGCPGRTRCLAEHPGSMDKPNVVPAGSDPPGALRLTVVDGYGPTETTTFATCYPMPGPASVPDVVPIGGVLDNMRVYVLDGGLRLVPPGVGGQLCPRLGGGAWLP